MKFQNPSLNFVFEQTDGRRVTHTRTHARTSRNQYATHFFKVGGIKIINSDNIVDIVGSQPRLSLPG